MSPEVSIEPVDIVPGQHCGEFFTDAVLTETPYSERDGFADGGAEFVGESLQLLVSCFVDSDTRTLHAKQHTASYAEVEEAPPVNRPDHSPP